MGSATYIVTQVFHLGRENVRGVGGEVRSMHQPNYCDSSVLVFSSFDIDFKTICKFPM